MIVRDPHLTTKIEIWAPKYHSESGEWLVLISKFKVKYSSPVIIINFTKAKHLKGQRFAVRRQDVERSPVGTNGKIQVYKVPFSLLEYWESADELKQVANELFKEE